MEEKQKKDRRKGLLGTALVHAVILLLLLFLGFRAPWPPPKEVGLLVNFGTDESGSGDVQPLNQQEIRQQENFQQEKKTNQQEELMTQDFEKAPVITENDDKTKTTDDITNEKIQEDPDEKKDPEVDKSKLFTKKNSDDDNKSNSEGDNDDKGDQGVPDGDPNADAHGDRSFGLGDRGIKYSLGDRKLLSIPKIEDLSQEVGIVVIAIKVDRSGRVISAEYTSKNSTTTSPYLIKLAKKAAMKARWNGDPSAAEEQFGTITVDFSVE